MCGICGIVNLKESKPPSTDLVKKMIGSLTHRGPDSCGYYRDRMVALGHSRLAIIDLYSGSQPLSNEDETIWITFNGEIFNYLELRDELISKGHIFKTKSDTETIVHAWEEWGDNCFDRFNGQWALALWDTRKQELILSRDRHGIRPLYYTMADNRFLFGSEIKALFCDKKVKREFDPDGFSEIFTFWSTVAPKTAYRDIKELPPGNFAVIKKGHMTSIPYWSVSFPKQDSVKSIDEYSEELREILVNASQLRFTRSDVPVGAYLSGGIDSSITSAIVSKYTNTKLNTYSLRFKDSEFDEGQYQKDMVQRLGTEHHDVVVSNQEIGEIFPEVIKHTERPILRSGPAPLFLLSRLVRNSGHKVVVTGEGADEVLAGYDIFREAKVRRFIAHNPDSPKVQEYLKQLYPWMERAPGKAPAFAKAFFSKNLDLNDPCFSHRPRWNSSSIIMQMFSKEFKEQSSADWAVENLKKNIPNDFKNWNTLNQDQWLEYTTLLSGYILSAQGDRMLMANSVEGRFPFLDPNLVDFANKLPPHIKLKDLNEKYILKKAFTKEIPQSILNRSKQPYRAPDIQSFFFEGKKLDWIEEVTSDAMVKEAGVFNPVAVQRLMDKCLNKSASKMSNTDNMRAVGIFSTMLSYKHFIKEDGFPITTLSETMTIIDRV